MAEAGAGTEILVSAHSRRQETLLRRGIQASIQTMLCTSMLAQAAFPSVCEPAITEIVAALLNMLKLIVPTLE